MPSAGGLHHDASTGSLAQSLGNSISLQSLVTTAESTGAATPRLAIPPATARTFAAIPAADSTVAVAPTLAIPSRSGHVIAGSATADVKPSVQLLLPTVQAAAHNPAAPPPLREGLPGTAHLARSLVNSAISGTHAQLRPVHHAQVAPAPASFEGTARAPPRWVIEEVIEFGPVIEDATKEPSEDILQKMCKPRRNPGNDGIFGSCFRVACVDDYGAEARSC